MICVMIQHVRNCHCYYYRWIVNVVNGENDVLPNVRVCAQLILNANSYKMKEDTDANFTRFLKTAFQKESTLNP